MSGVVPMSCKRILVNEISHRFREVAAITNVPIPKLNANEVLVKNKFLGINASDVNFSAGRYDSSLKPPFTCGFEGVGHIVSKGSDVKLALDQPVAYMTNGAFTEYMVVSSNQALPIPSVEKEFIPLLVSGLTASISLNVVGEMKAGEKVLVTAAAGGTGMFAVQLARLAGCHVIGTCSSAEKMALLKSLGCDRVVNYTEENLATVLKSEYPTGIDIVYESVGGEMFDIGVNSLAKHGRLIVIGWISGYQTDKGFNRSRTLESLPQRLLPKSASVRGFFLFNYPKEIKKHLTNLAGLLESGSLKCQVDMGEKSAHGPFVGLESIFDAVDFMYSKKSIGKVVVELPDNVSSKL